MQRPMCIYAALFGAFIALLIPYLIDSYDDHDRLKEMSSPYAVTVMGWVDDIVVKEEKTRVTLKKVTFLNEEISTDQNGKYGLILYFSENQDVSGLKISQKLAVSGKLYKFDVPMNEGQFDQRQYYYIRGIDGRVINAEILEASDEYSMLKNSLHIIRENVKRKYETYLSKEHAGIMTALVLGDKNSLDEDIKSLYQNAGISHILSLSGLHIATLGLGLLKFLKHISYRFGLMIESFIRKNKRNTKKRPATEIMKKSKLVAEIISTVILTNYCLMTGMSVSTIRAFIMFLMGLTADRLNRTYDLLSAAAFSSMIALFVNPLFIFDPSFQLSFGAVLSIGILIPVISTLFRHIPKVFEGLNLSISVWLGTLPICASHFCQVSFGGILLNLIVVPLMSLLLPFGIGMAIVGDGISHILAKTISIILNIYEAASEAFVSVKWLTWVTGKPGVPQILAYYMIICVALAINSYTESRGSRIKIAKYAKPLISTSLMLIACLLLLIRPQNTLEIRNLSIGQGDCSVISTKTDVIIIDGGSSTLDQSGKYRLIPLLKACGIGKIDYIFISHFDTDHVSAIFELMEDEIYRNRIGSVIISPISAGTAVDNDNLYKLFELSDKNKIPIYGMYAGDKVNAGNLNIECISPMNMDFSDENDASMVLLLTEESTGYKALFTGDISSNTEKNLIDVLPKLDYIKVAHHGSKYSSDDAFLDGISKGKIGTTIGIISAGEKNSYGHPHDETLTRLNKHGIITLRTDKLGETKITIENNKINLSFFNIFKMTRKIEVR